MFGLPSIDVRGAVNKKLNNATKSLDEIKQSVEKYSNNAQNYVDRNTSSAIATVNTAVRKTNTIKKEILDTVNTAEKESGDIINSIQNGIDKIFEIINPKRPATKKNIPPNSELKEQSKSNFNKKYILWGVSAFILFIFLKRVKK